MSQYIVIKHFEDLQDNRYPYRIGQVFPRDGVEVSQERLEELSGSNNRRHMPLIEALPENCEDAKNVENTKPTRNNGKKKEGLDNAG